MYIDLCFQVQVRDLPTARCYSFMGSYLQTLEGRLVKRINEFNHKNKKYAV